MFTLTQTSRVFTALVLFAVTSVSAAGTKNEWSRVVALPRGRDVRVESAGRKMRGTLVRASDSNVVLITAAGEATVARADISRVWVKDKSHRLRNSLIGAGVAGAMGIITAATLGTLISNESGEDLKGVMIGLPTAAGAAIAAAMPTGGFRKIYDSKTSNAHQ